MNHGVAPEQLLSKTRWRVLIASIVAFAITVVAWWRLYPAVLFPYALEVSMQSFTKGAVQVYFDRGGGLRESESTRQGLAIGATNVRLPLPAGRYKELRFDPIDRVGAASFGELKIIGPNGATVRVISFAELVPNDQIESIEIANGRLEMTPKPGASDPQFSIRLDPELVLPFDLNSQLAAARWWLLAWFAGTLAALLVVENTWRNRDARRQAVGELIRHRPRAALAICAVLAAVASSYPVVFFGRSFVSPSTAILLYEGIPSVPGYTDIRGEDARGADVGAMMWQHLPYTVQEHRALQAGALPLWNRFASCGVTLFGQGQSMFGDPLHLLVIAANGAPWAFDLKYLLAKTLFGCGLAWCVWSMTRDFAASAILCVSSIFIAFFNYRLNHPGIFTMGYAPWILVAWFHITAADGRRAFRNGLLMWFAANWLVITSGTVKEAYLLALTLNVTGALIYFTTTWRSREWMRRTVILACAAVSLLVAATPLWWTFLRSLASAYTNYDAPGISQVDGAWFIGLFDDIFYREFVPGRNVFKPAANFLILLGCFWAVLQPRRLWAARPAFICAIAAAFSISLAFNFGPFLWPRAWIFAVPLFRNVYNLDTVFSGAAIVQLGILAGWGFAAARQPLVSAKLGRFGWPMAAIVLGLFVIYLVVQPTNFGAHHRWTRLAQLTPDAVYVYSQFILLPLSAWTLTLLARRHLRGGKLTGPVATAALVAAFLILGRHGQHLRIIPSTLIAAPGPRADLLIPSESVKLLQQRTALEPGRVVGLAHNLTPGFATAHGLEMINGANALENRHYRQFAEAAGLVKPAEWLYELPPAELPTWRPIADFLNVRFVAAPNAISFPSEGYREIAAFDLRVFESTHHWPRAFFSNHVERYPGPADLVAMIRARMGQGPFAAVQDGDRLPASLPANRGTGAEPVVVAARDYRLETNTTTFTIDAPSPGIAVLHETWLPGDFRATLNGAPVEYFRINHAFKGVVIPNPGVYRVAFSYWPSGFSSALLAGAVGLLMIVGTLVATRWISSPIPNRHESADAA